MEESIAHFKLLVVRDCEREGEETHGKIIVEAVANAAERAMVNDVEDREEEAQRMTINAAPELGGAVEQLGKAFEQVWKTTSVKDNDLLVCGRL